MDELYSIGIGLGLAAACGFRVFLPLLAMGIAERTGHLALGGDFEWIATDAALIAFSAATLLEIAGYYVPWVDNLLDTVAAPTAVIAGVVVMASAVSELDPLLRWSLAVIAGGGVSGVVQAATTLARQLSSWTTGGFGNPVISTGEAVGAVVMSGLAVLAPWLAGAIVLIGLVAVIRWLRRSRRSKATSGDRLIGRPA